MELRFLAPGFLVLLALALVPWVGPFATRDRRHAALRAALFVLLALALARPARVVVDPMVVNVYVLDRSASVTDSADRAAVAGVTDALQQRASASARRVVIEVGAAEAQREALALPRDVTRMAFGAADASPLGAALAAAARAVPPGAVGHVDVYTDGLATEPGDGSAATHALADLAARGVVVDVHALDGAPGDLRPVALAARGVLRVGLATALEARLVGGGQVVTCRLMGADQASGAASGGEVELDRVEGVIVDGEARVALTFEPATAGFLDVALVVDVTDGVDPRGRDLRLERTLAVQDPLRVLYLGERVTGGAEALSALLGPGFAADASAGAPTAAQLDGADLVVLDDRPAASVPEAFQRALVDAVATRGLGFVAAGGEASFGPGGYHEQPLEAILPVEFVQKEEKRDPSTTLVVIIDTSGSMGGNRVQLAKEVARLAIRRLLPHDKVGMVEFYGAKRWAVPIQPASNSIEIERALNRLDAGGGTVILPAIEEAYYGLKNVRTRYKHVLILTDGGVETGAFEPLLRRMADEGMNVSTVLIGGDAHSEFLVSLSNWGQGRFYSVPNRFNLPEILLKQPASAKLPAYRAGLASVRARGGEAWFGEVDPTTLGPVAGYVETRARPGAERVIETLAEAHPILTSWRYGLGRVTALMTEPTGPGSAPWRGSGDAGEGARGARAGDYGAWLARALERTAADAVAPFVFELTRDGDEALLIAERRSSDAAADGLRPFARYTVSAAADSATGTEGPGPEAGAPWAFLRVAPDRFEARLPLGSSAGLRAVCGARAGRDGGAPGAAAPTDARGARVGALVRVGLDPLTGGARERQVAPESLGALATLAQRTAASSAVAPATAAGGGVARLHSYSTSLALLALVVYLLDIAYRRWPRRVASFV
ncbi:MAG: VWA domain-containing protein [Planctomycetota bacterium]